MQSNVQYQPQFQAVQQQAYVNAGVHPQQQVAMPVSTTVIHHAAKPDWKEMPRPGFLACGDCGNCCVWLFCPCLAVDNLYIISKDASRQSLMFILFLVSAIVPVLWPVRLIACWMARTDVYEQMEIDATMDKCKDLCCIFFHQPCYMNKLQGNIEKYDEQKRQMVGAAMKVSHISAAGKVTNYGSTVGGGNSTVVTYV